MSQIVFHPLVPEVIFNTGCHSCASVHSIIRTLATVVVPIYLSEGSANGRCFTVGCGDRCEQEHHDD
ncbi:MAG: hypothetical protein F4X47_04265 [Gammaproteobacteria bacterium]|nr:hypothetical protein [Gammaproteobacteria bacterium]MYC51516.1 hypothetical protein [Gammaproteobacteria bacterium]